MPDLRAGDQRLANATVPACLVDGTALAADRDGLAAVDLDLAGGKIARLTPAGTTIPTLPVTNLGRRMVWPGFVDLHTHIDKGHIWERAHNPDGTHGGAVRAVGDDRTANWSAGDVRRRMDFSLRCAYAHGTVALRTHIDSLAPQAAISWPVFAELRSAWAGRIELQAASIAVFDVYRDPAAARDMADIVAAHGGLLGGSLQGRVDVTEPLDLMFALAAERGLDIDLHVDETLDAESRCLAQVAHATRRHSYAGRVTVGHICSLAQQDDAEATAALVAAAGISVVSLPMCNLYLQDRIPGRTPRLRGVTALHELRAAGVALSIASDNTRDPFYFYGDLDMVEVLREGARIGQLEFPFGDWPNAFARAPADTMKLPHLGRFTTGASANLVICEGRSYSEVLSRPQARRIVLRAGRAIDTTPPDHAELDGIL